MLVRARDRHEAPLACDLAALLEERDVLRGDTATHDADLRTRAELVRAMRRRERVPDIVTGMRVPRDAVARVAEAARAWRRELRVAAGEDWTDDAPVGRVLALAFPDRVAQRRPGDGSRYLMRNGAGALLRDSPTLAREPWLAIAETDGRAPEAGVYLAASLTLADVRADFASQLVTADAVAWDDATQSVRAHRRETLGALVLAESVQQSPDPALVRQALLGAIRGSGLALLSWNEAARRLRERIAFVHRHAPGWPDVSDAALLERLDDWLGPHLDGIRSRGQLANLDLHGILLATLDWPHRSRLDALAPTHITAPTGSRLPIDYADPEGPVVRVRLQEMFGVRETPAVLEGRLPVTLHLLSPAHRPVQVTRDLAGFWRTSYFDVRKDMKGRYPRHYWPDDPLVAEPTRRAKPGGRQRPGA
jgi:ATP-dependent helicase HrpB